MSKDKAGINELNRRDFLQAGLRFGTAASALAAGYAAVPDAFARAVYAAKQAGVNNDNVLVMIQLAGGNDHLRTVIPLQDPKLHDLRPILAANTVPMALPLNAQFGLNQNMPGIKTLWDQGKVAIVEGVGYPNPSFSHFESIRVWETGDPTRRQLKGWLGRALATSYDSYGHPLTGCACGTTSTPGALRDADSTVAVIENQLSYGFASSDLEAAVGAVYGQTPGIYAPVHLIGDTVRHGRYGEPPDLQRLDDGNLRHTVDCRSVYQEILQVHLQASGADILGGRFQPVRFLGRGR